jgi:hypothetical protein
MFRWNVNAIAITVENGLDRRVWPRAHGLSGLPIQKSSRGTGVVSQSRRRRPPAWAFSQAMPPSAMRCAPMSERWTTAKPVSFAPGPKPFAKLRKKLVWVASKLSGRVRRMASREVKAWPSKAATATHNRAARTRFLRRTIGKLSAAPKDATGVGLLARTAFRHERGAPVARRACLLPCAGVTCPNWPCRARSGCRGRSGR